MRGTLILLAAGLFARVLGFFYRIMLARELGAQGMGLLSLVQPVIFFAVTLATAGLPVAISKIVAERAAVKPQAVREVLRTSLVFVLITSTALTIILLLLARPVAHGLLTDPRSYLPLLSLIPILGIISLSVVYRGYFQGLQQMTPTAIAQAVEQVVRLLLVLWLLPHFLARGVAYAAAGAGLALVLGELAGLIVLYISYRVTQPLKGIKDGPPDPSGTLREIMAISAPVTLTRIVASITDLADTAVIPRRLMAAGFTRDAATAFFGNLYGMAMPLLFFPTVFTFALAQNLVPAVSEAFAKGDLGLVRRRSDQAIRLGVLISLPTSAVFLLLGHSLGLLFYGNRAVGDLIVPLALAAPFLYLEVTVSAILRGLGKAAVATVNGLVGSIIRLVIVYSLTANPRIGVAAVIVGIAVDLAVSFFLNLWTLARTSGLTIDLGAWLIRPLLASVPLLVFLVPAQNFLIALGQGLWVATLGAIGAGLLVFVAAAYLAGIRLRPGARS